MDNLLKNIESMEITNTQELIINKIIANIENLINNCLVPQKLVGSDRPCDKNDFNDYCHTIDGNLIDLLAELNNLKNYNVDSRSLSIEDVDVREILLKSVIVVGEQSEKNPWNNSSTLELANKLLLELCWFFGVDKFSDIFANNDEDNKLRDILLLLRGKLLKSTWKTFPGSVCCYKWLLHQVEV